MDTRFTEEQQAFAAAVREFCRREVGDKEKLDAYTEHGREAHSRQLYRKLAETGYLGIGLPEEYGGSGGSLIEKCLFFEELWRGLVPVHGAGPSHTVAGIYAKYASEVQKKRVLGSISAGSVWAISMSEPEAGSDAAAISCKAERVPGGYRINGQKTWCSDAQFAEGILLVARTDRTGPRHAGLTMFEVPTTAEGLSIHPISTMGGNEVNDLYFADVFVPDESVVGVLGDAWRQLMSGLNNERLLCAAQGLGMAQRTFDDLLGYLKERSQFGQAIGTFQAVRHRVASLAVEIEAAKSLTYDTVYRVTHGIGERDELTRMTSIAKVKATETAKQAALEGVQLMGGYGYATEFGMERHLRLAIPTTIYAGTNEIQREIIASTFGLR